MYRKANEDQTKNEVSVQCGLSDLGAFEIGVAHRGRVYLSAACKADRFDQIIRKNKMVEAAGIEPASKGCDQ